MRLSTQSSQPETTHHKVPFPAHDEWSPNTHMQTVLEHVINDGRNVHSLNIVCLWCYFFYIFAWCFFLFLFLFFLSFTLSIKMISMLFRQFPESAFVCAFVLHNLPASNKWTPMIRHLWSSHSHADIQLKFWRIKNFLRVSNRTKKQIHTLSLKQLNDVFSFWSIH